MVDKTFSKILDKAGEIEIGQKFSEKAQEPFGSVSLVANYFVILDYAFLVGLYLLLIRKYYFKWLMLYESAQLHIHQRNARKTSMF